MFKKILIANRGEIACRVIRTARRMGIRTVAVYSEADKDARHVELADEAVLIGPPPSAQSYLRDRPHRAGLQGHRRRGRAPRLRLPVGERGVLRGAGEGGHRLHRAEGARDRGDGRQDRVQEAGARGGVNTIPGHNSAIGSPDEAVAIAQRHRLPGDDQGLGRRRRQGPARRLRTTRECHEGFTSCRNEAKNAFGDDRVFIEKFVEEPRHIEIQVLGDAHGNIVYLNERECSIQRRHQKVIEEAPSPFLDDATRRAMGEQAVQLARAVQYQSAGTVEFVVGKDKSFYFLEMNTRLQVEHPVTEMITGLDLVELMIRVAAGERLPLTQEDVQRNGWAIECRINAEDPLRNFLPSSGRLVKFIAAARGRRPGARRHRRLRGRRGVDVLRLDDRQADLPRRDPRPGDRPDARRRSTPSSSAASRRTSRSRRR